MPAITWDKCKCCHAAMAYTRERRTSIQTVFQVMEYIRVHSCSFIWTPLHQSTFFLGLQRRKVLMEKCLVLLKWNILSRSPLAQCRGLSARSRGDLLSGQRDSPSINRAHSELPSINMRQSIKRPAGSARPQTRDERACVSRDLLHTLFELLESNVTAEHL